MIEFEDARRIVADSRAHDWPASHGTFMVADYGFEDSQSWLPTWGAKEWLVDGDPEFMLMDQPVLLVDKQTGELTDLTWRDGLDRIDKMRELGNVPK